MTQPLGTAVVGAGYWGPNLIRNFGSYDGTDLRWVCDLDDERARRVVGSRSTVAITRDLDDVLSDPAVQGVAVATPAATHTPIVLACLEAGKHVLVEKPLANSLDDARKLVDAAERAGLVLMCDHTYCYTPAVRRIRQYIDEGALGDIQFVDSVRINLGLVQSDVDVFWDLSPHDISILDYILPGGCRPDGVAAQGSDPIGAEQHCVGYLTLRMPTGVIAHTHVNWLSPVKVRTMIVGGSRRTLVWDDLDPAQRLRVYDRGVDLSSALDGQARRDALVSYRIGDMIAPALSEGEALRGVVQEFAGCIRDGRTPVTDGTSGVRVLQVLDAASRSLAVGGGLVSVNQGVQR